MRKRVLSRLWRCAGAAALVLCAGAVRADVAFMPGDYYVLDLKDGILRRATNVASPARFKADEYKTTKIVLRHLVEPVSGYSFELYRTPTQGEEMRAHIFFTPWEALGLAEAIAGSMSVISFGIPMVIPHDTSAYEAENRELRNVRAA